jgi:hypothetical protein
MPYDLIDDEDFFLEREAHETPPTSPFYPFTWDEGIHEL